MLIPHDKLDPETLQNLIEHFVAREGTDYGAVEITMEAKIRQVRRQLETGEAVITFDPSTETCSILPRDVARRLEAESGGITREYEPS